MLLSVPYWALIILHYGSLWGLFFLLTTAPEFMNKVLKFDLTNSGVLASLPHLARFLAGFGFGYIGDVLRLRQWMSPTAIRKVFTIFCKCSFNSICAISICFIQIDWFNGIFVYVWWAAHVIPGALLISIIFVGTEGSFAAYACVGIITASLGANGAAAITNLQNSQDLAPNYAGALYSVINFIGTTSGFISTMVVSHFTQDTVSAIWYKYRLSASEQQLIPISALPSSQNDDNPMEGWSTVLLIGGVIYIAPAILFWVFGSAEVQPWNDTSNANDTTAIDTESAADPRTEETTWARASETNPTGTKLVRKHRRYFTIHCDFVTLVDSNEVADSICLILLPF